MDHRQTIHQHRNVVPGRASAFGLVLVDDLQDVVVDVLFINQVDVLAAAVIPGEHLDMVLLYTRRLLNDAVVGTGHLLREEPLPLGVGEGDLVEVLQLAAQVVDQLLLAGDAQVLVSLLFQLGYQASLERPLTLIGRLANGFRDELGHDGALVRERNRFVAGRDLGHDTSVLQGAAVAISRQLRR